MIHALPFGSQPPNSGSVIMPPSRSGLSPRMPTQPPQVRVPMTGPSLKSLKPRAKVSQSLPPWRLMRVAMWPWKARDGVVSTGPP